MRCRNIVSNTAYKFFLPLVIALAAQPALAKMYKWVDSQGNVHYTDTLPPNAAGLGNAELGKSGDVVRKTESAEEKRKRLEAEAEAAERKKAAKEQARKDRALLDTYTTEQEIDLARDRALEHHNLAIKSAESRIAQIEPGLKELAQKIDSIEKSKKPVPPFLTKQYAAKQAEVEEARRIIKTNQDALVSVRERYDADKQRFHELTTKR